MTEGFRPLIARIIGAFVAALAGLLTKHLGLELDADAQAALTTFLVLLAYSLVHRVVSKKVNPVDAAKTPTPVQAANSVQSSGTASKIEFDGPGI